MAARAIDGPEEDWLDARDMVRLTRLSESTIDRLVELHVFPPPRQVSARIRLWHWEDYLYWTLRVKIFGLPAPDEAPEPPKVSPPGRGQKTSQPDQ